jgi:hypothetical protein
VTAATVDTRYRLPALLIWIAYFVIPNDAGGLVHGIPLGPIEATALLMLAWLAIVGVRVPGAAVVALLLAVTYVTGAAIPGQGGFRARYFANAAATGGHERSTEFPGSAFTRLDRRLHFDADQLQFPLPFFNDNSRFNFYKVGEPQRRYLEFAVRWSGLWWVDSERPRLYIDAPAASGQVFIDGEEALAVAAGVGSPAVREMALTPGWHRLDVTFSSPYAAGRSFSSGVMNGNARVPFDASMVVTQQIRDWQMTSARMLGWIKSAADVALLAWLAWVFVTRLARVTAGLRLPATSTLRLTHVLWLFAAVAAAEALIFALPWWHHNMLLVGGDDTMTYEGYARDILLNGILMNGGLPPGQGEPFYYQAFYPYFLAAAHAVFGESMFGPVLLQRLLAALAMWKIVEIAVAFSSERIWQVALPIAALFIAWKFWPIAAQPLNESLYVPLLAATAASLIRLCRQPQRRAALTSGLLSGLTTITRSTALLSWVVVWPACWLAMTGVPRRHAAITILAAATLAVFSLIAIRNWIVAGVFAPSSTELGITLLGGNEVPPEVTIDLAKRASLYSTFGIGHLTATVIEYAITAPGSFARNLGRKALFALGFYEPYAPGWGYSPVYIAVWTTAIAGLVLTLRRHRDREAPALFKGLPYLIPALIAVTQLVAVVIVYPKGERLILPIHTMLVPYSAIAAWHVLQTAAARRRRRSV